MHFSKLEFNYAAIDDFVLLPAHLDRSAFADPARYRERTKYVTDPTNPGLYNGPYRVSELAAVAKALSRSCCGMASRSRTCERSSVRALSAPYAKLTIPTKLPRRMADRETRGREVE